MALPPGMIGNPQAIPRCTVDQLGELPEESECPLDSQVGISAVTVLNPVSGTFTEPVYNMEPPKGLDIVARFGFFAAVYPTFINVRVDPSDYSLIASVEGAPSAAGLLEATTTLWGVPAASSHDGLRLTPLEARNHETPEDGREATLPEAPFLSNPTDCSLEREMTITARSYQLPDQPSSMTVSFPQISGCGKLAFEPTFSAVATNSEAAAPTGLDAELLIPQDETAQGRATSTLKSAVVTLPQGLTINPAAGGAMEACSSEQVGYGRNESSHCPNASKFGSAEVEVPALERTLHGSLYQRPPEPDQLFRFWLVADELGVHLKLPAEIKVDNLTGQVTTIFNGIETLGGLPQVPVRSLKLHVFGGARAPLATPPTCGTYQTHFQFTPWSGKPAVESDTAMEITSGCRKGGFAPGLTAGSTRASAGSFSPFALTLTRRDGEANPSTMSVHMPQGLLARLAGVPLCPEAHVATGACPESSKVGSLIAAAGVGAAPLWIPQPGKSPTAVYLAGPYKGAPYSILSVVPAQAGPFDLGTVVNRAGIYVEPETARATIATDPLPQILEGVPITYRTIHVVIDRPNFTLNPTGCSKKKIFATLIASNGALAEPADGFQAANCARLKYNPKLRLTFKGATKRTGNPAVRAVLTQKPGQANTQAATVILPPTQFIDNAHISAPCTRVQFAQEACPRGSVLGIAKAITPLLDEPLKGKVYFRSNGGERELPDIVADLRGPIRIVLVGFIDAVQKEGTENSRVRTRFLRVPDAPVTRFEMNLFGGKRGLIENSANLCKAKRRAEIKLRAQNGRELITKPVIRMGCGGR
ncbi:MAG TPA: hypothetical protein VFM51_12165 [Solirubrobacterales bacterium]|nr:hypothetical protein [Solirubrobacterales bacterium]